MQVGLPKQCHELTAIADAYTEGVRSGAEGFELGE